MKKSRICLALDGMGLEDSLGLTEKLGKKLYTAKIHSLLDEVGPGVIDKLEETGVERPWVDYKLHDTWGTVALRVKALAENGAKIITVHASGGVRMMKAAVEEARKFEGVEIWAITVLTSLDDEETARSYGKDRTREEIVLEFATMAMEADVNGVVCSALEVGMLYRAPDLFGLKFIVPGTRSAGVALGQQKRSATPREAVDDGATLLVAGSQVTKADDPVAAFDAMEDEIS